MAMVSKQIGMASVLALIAIGAAVCTFTDRSLAGGLGEQPDRPDSEKIQGS